MDLKSEAFTKCAIENEWQGWFEPQNIEQGTAECRRIVNFTVGQSHQGRVHRVKGQVGEKLSLSVGFDELDGLRGQAIGQMLAGRAIGEPRTPIGFPMTPLSTT